ncbi:MFS transporter [Actinophytocola sp.]|uniref:MFS transporter n=1 Tax=Actinophytocola sp. TaxID=1872138 RepID=UPI002ED0CD3B
MKRELDRRLPLDLYISSGARAASMLGHSVAVTALTLDLHADGRATWVIAALLFAGTLPLVLLSPLAGLLVDRHDSRQLLVVSGLWQAAAYTLLVFVDHPVAVLFLMTLASVGTAVTTPLLMSLTPLMVLDRQLAAANGLQQGMVVIALMAGPTISGMMFGLTGDARMPLLLNVMIYLAIVGTGLLISTRRRPQLGESRPRAMDGVTVLFADRAVGPVVTVAVLLVLSLHLTYVAQVFLVRDTFGASALTFGLMQATHTAGFLFASVAASRLNTTRRILVGTPVMAALLSVAMLVISFARSLTITFAMLLIAGFAVTVVLVVVGTLLMQRIPKDVLGRALASFTGAHRAAALVAYSLGGWLASLISPLTMYAVSGIVALIALFVTAPMMHRALATV